MSVVEIALGLLAFVGVLFGGFQLNAKRRAETKAREDLAAQAKRDEEKRKRLSEKHRDEELKRVEARVEAEKKEDSVDFLNDLTKKRRP